MRFTSTFEYSELILASFATFDAGNGDDDNVVTFYMSFPKWSYWVSASGTPNVVWLLWSHEDVDILYAFDWANRMFHFSNIAVWNNSSSWYEMNCCHRKQSDYYYDSCFEQAFFIISLAIHKISYWEAILNKEIKKIKADSQGNSGMPM